MAESSVEYGFPPEDELEQKKVQKLFGKTRTRLTSIHSNKHRDRVRIEREIRYLMDSLDSLGVELPCQGVEYRGVVVGRDPEVSQDAPPAPFVKWGKALGVFSDLVED